MTDNYHTIDLDWCNKTPESLKIDRDLFLWTKPTDVQDIEGKLYRLQMNFWAGQPAHIMHPWSPSSNIDDAVMLAEWMDSRGWIVDISRVRTAWDTVFHRYEGLHFSSAWEPTFSLSVAKAAHEALEKEINAQEEEK
jgi:hypothetical protein